MNTKINLALEKEGIKKETQKFFYATLIAFVLVLILTASLLGYNFLLGNESQILLEGKKTIENSIKKQGDKKATILLLNEHLSSIDTIMKSRQKLAERLLEILAMIPPTLAVKEADITVEKISIKINSNSLSDVDTFVKQLHELEPAPTSIKQTKIETFGISNKELVYDFELEFDYPEFFEGKNKGRKDITDVTQ